MSRTFRRNKSYLIKSWVGRPDDIDSWDCKRFQLTDPSQVYQIKVRRFISDSGSKGYPCGVPRWYRRIFGSKATRIANRREIQRCVTQDCWDDHKPHFFRDNAAYSWW
jgi:hypothetical protein